MRIGVGIILLVDLFIRSLSIKAFFTDEGVLPLNALQHFFGNTNYISLHTISGELWWQIILFVINACCAVALLIGYRTRFFTFMCWVFLISLQNRNPFILQGGDDLLRLLLFWGLFLPWGDFYSVLSSPSRTHEFSLPAIGYLLLTCSVLFFSALLKTSPEWHTEGSAVYYALSLDQIRLPFGTFIYKFPRFMRVLTYMVFYIELLAPLLVTIPFIPSKIRLGAIFCIIGLYVSIALSLYVGLFYIIGIISMVGLFPSAVMDWLELRFIRAKTVIKSSNTSVQELKAWKKIVRYFKHGAIAMTIIFCLFINMSNLPAFPYELNTTFFKCMKFLKLDQNWGMFSPYILKDDGWFVYSGFDANGKHIDIKHNLDSVVFSKPQYLVADQESDRWRKFEENYTSINNNFMRPYYCKYLLNKWNNEHPEKQILNLTIYFMKETSLPNYQTKPLKKIVACDCQQ